MEGNNEFDAIYDETDIGHNDYVEDPDEDVVKSADECEVVTEVEPGIEINVDNFLGEMQKVIKRRIMSWHLAELEEQRKTKDGNDSPQKRRSSRNTPSGIVKIRMN